MKHSPLQDRSVTTSTATSMDSSSSNHDSTELVVMQVDDQQQQKKNHEDCEPLIQKQQQQQPPSSFRTSDSTGSSSSSDATEPVEVVPVVRRSKQRLTLWKRNKMSLSRAATTPWIVGILIPLLSLLTHGIFYYGQTAPMWKLHLSQQVDLWANATNLEAKTTFQTLGLPRQNLLAQHEEKTVKSFSYWYAIQELWKAKAMPGKVLPRSAAILLVVFSGIWPHLKLVLLNMTWLFSVHQRRRTRLLTWLSTLGKWSLADVLVVCVMVGVLHLDWTVDPAAIKTGLVDNLPFCLQIVKSLYSASDICTTLLKDVDCHVQHKSIKRWAECKACVGVVKTALDYPETARDSFRPVLDGIEMSGGGQVTLRVLGLNGIYAFCAAVILSILISLLVDILDVRAHRAHARAQRLQSPRRQRTYMLPNGNESTVVTTTTTALDDSNDGDSYDMDDPYLFTDDSDDSDNEDTNNNDNDDGEELMERGGRLSSEDAYHELVRSTSETVGVWTLLNRYATLGVCIATLIAVLFGIFAMTIERTVEGAIPQVLRDVLGIVWNRSYSLFTLVQTTGAAGGMDYMLMATFGLFVVVGPAIRAVLCLIAGFVKLNGRNRRKLLAMIELVGAFCAWEVFLVAVGMVDMLMPATTSTVIMQPQCASVSEDGTCLKVNFDLQRSVLWVVVGGGLLIGLSNLVFGSGRRPPSPPQSASSSPRRLCEDRHGTAPSSATEPLIG